MKQLTKTGTIFDKIMGILFVFACVLLVFMMLSVGFDVLMRYFVGRPQIWVIEVVAYSLLFITFLAAAWVLRGEGHVKMDLVLDRLSPRGRATLNIVTSTLATIMWLVIAFYTSQLVWILFQRGEIMNTALKPPKAPLVAVIPLGSFLLFIQSLRRTYGYLGSWRTTSEQIKVADKL